MTTEFVRNVTAAELALAKNNATALGQTTANVNANRALLARPSRIRLAGHDGLQASNDMAWRATA